eukprot:Rmarinus@m.19209
MKEACKSFVGVHDFRNFCKMDAEKVSNFERTILSYSIAPCPGASTGGTTSGTPLEGTNSGDERMTMWVATIRGHAFLWHQVRNMMAVLFLVGMKLESPDIVSQLLDLSKYPRKPQYSMASGAPLVLFECGFEGLHWRTSSAAQARLCREMELIAESRSVSLCMSRAMFDGLELQENIRLSDGQIAEGPWSVTMKSVDVKIPGDLCGLSGATGDIAHMLLRDRPVENTYEQRIQKIRAKQEATGRSGESS